jgi:hypothetical protein
MLAQEDGQSIEMHIDSYLARWRVGCTCIETPATVLVPLIVQLVDEHTLIFRPSRGSVEHVVLQVATVVVNDVLCLIRAKEVEELEQRCWRLGI